MMCVLWTFDAGDFVMALVWFAKFNSGQVDFLGPQLQGILQVCRRELVVGKAELSGQLSAGFADSRSMGWRK